METAWDFTTRLALPDGFRQRAVAEPWY